MAAETKIKKLQRHTAQRHFFDVVRYAFRILAHQSSIILGSAWAFVGAVLIVLVWILSGPTFHFSDTWQLVINTATTVVTFLMVFLIQNTQNRDTKAVQLKLDELIRSIKSARNELVDLEGLSDEELQILQRQFQQLRKKAEHDGNHRRHRRQGRAPTQSK
jgi:low affinity Fe/Cu permease